MMMIIMEILQSVYSYNTSLNAKDFGPSGSIHSLKLIWS
jgi:hypothetical protein